MNQTFHLSLNGDCNDDYVNEETTLMDNQSAYNTTENDLFLRTGIKRNEVATLTFVDSIEGHSIEDENCTDAGNVENGKILAWITPSTEYEGLYDVVIGQEGGVIAPSNSKNLLSYLTNAVSINPEKLDTSKITGMHWMFTGCNSLTELDLSHFDTSKTIYMHYMFYNCTNLLTIDISRFDTRNVSMMTTMFNNCTSLTLLDVSNWEVMKVTNFSSMFNNCKALKTLDVSNWNVRNGELFYDMFKNCVAITSLDVSNWNMNNATDLLRMFQSCNALSEINFNNWRLSSTTNISSMLSGCKDLSNDSVNSILKALTTAEKIENKTLNQTNLFSSKLEIVPTLSNYQAFLDAGWTIE